MKFANVSQFLQEKAAKFDEQIIFGHHVFFIDNRHDFLARALIAGAQKILCREFRSPDTRNRTVGGRGF